MNITNPIYTSMSDSEYYCHLTDTGVWLCKHTDLNGVAIGAFGVGVAIATLMLVLCFLIVEQRY